jgi:hypothetical protein
MVVLTPWLVEIAYVLENNVASTANDNFVAIVLRADLLLVGVGGLRL